MGNKEVLICSFSAVLFCIVLKNLNPLEKHQAELAVCIVSKRENFEHRKAIRKSWLSYVGQSGKNVVAKFVVGKLPCPVHPQNKIDPHSCDRWEPKVPENSLISLFNLTKGNNPKKCRVVTYFHIQVMHNIMLNRIGLAEVFPLQHLYSNETVEVILYDAVSDEEIAIAHFSKKINGAISDGFIYKSSFKILLPKGYEFTLEVKLPERFKLQEWVDLDKELQMYDGKESHNNILNIKYLDQDGTVLSHRVTLLPLASLMFVVHNIPILKEHIQTAAERDAAYLQEANVISSKLLKEQSHHQDMILVDIVDTYRSLPDKILLCHEWFHNYYSIKDVLKTDDDCYVDLEKILAAKKEVGSDQMMWWGNFRTNWVVERHGKWRELTYSGSVYPRFACGSGYVVSHNIHSWLVSNKNSLQRFQGEDVSVGIWLSGLRIHHVQDDSWQCGKTCQKGLLSLPELTPESIQWHWNNSKVCHNPCESC
ncbi:UDP-GalNAc:beta-1,3-N-acetylgalactosaminyltransferase 2-like [Physella acuta]|uniref:UDP-GalNAc:beta-1, 3-N-acetylgalactosaminyltransferase 2-like n=1 Tax=Physella acuta TaxID=109671 RepID=UPI0027DBC2EE|nr:UDP-GalNAc:beta-1,3-N-acetylgalactosaminyltransferase 2-like [Physella acuta]